VKLGQQKKRSFLPILALIFIMFVGAFGFRLFILWNRAAEDPGRQVTLDIAPGSTFLDAAQKLEEAGVIRSVNSFVLLGKVKRLSGNIQAGELLFRTDMTPVEVLEVLSRGKAVSYSVTFPEGYTALQVVEILADKGLGDLEKFKALIEDASFARSLDLPADRLEGFLYPDTYSFPRGMSERDILGHMAGGYSKVFTDEYRKRAKELELTELEVVTLASIIEKETGSAAERPQVSAVFHNRMRLGYRMQSCPTVIYGIPEFDGDLTKEDLRTDHPYNTYTRSGLPPGPIANPGSDSIAAALYPADVSYLYFVSKGDGTHVFSNNLKDHNAAVRKYQLGDTP
jgi:UPF0755 protein